MSVSKDFDFHEEIERQKEQRRPFIEYVSKCKKLDIFTYESIKIMIDHGWDQVGYEFFKLQFWIFAVFFVCPFAIDLYNVEYVTND